LLCGDGAEGREYCVVEGKCIVEKGSENVLDTGDTSRKRGFEFDRIVRILDRGAIDWLGPLVRGILATVGGCMAKFDEDFGNVAGHGEGDMSIDIIPLEGKSQVF